MWRHSRLRSMPTTAIIAPDKKTQKASTRLARLFTEVAAGSLSPLTSVDTLTEVILSCCAAGSIINAFGQRLKKEIFSLKMSSRTKITVDITMPLQSSQVMVYAESQAV